MPDPVDHSAQNIEDDGYITVSPALRPEHHPSAIGTTVGISQHDGEVFLTLTRRGGSMCSVLLEPAEAHMLARHLIEQADAVERTTSQGDPA